MQTGTAQTQTTAQGPVLQPLPELPPEPHCITWYSGSPCDVLKQQYQAALQKRQQIELSNYVETQKFEAAQAAAARAEAFQAQLNQVHAQMQQQELEAIRAKEAAHDEGYREGMLRGAGLGLVVAIVLTAIVLVVKRLRGRYTTLRT